MPHRRALLFMLAAALCPASLSAKAAPGPVVTLLGDSITAGLGLPAGDALPARLEAALRDLGVEARVRGAGVSGDTTGGALARLDFSVEPDTAVCVVELGANDYLQSVPPAEVKANLLGIIARLKARHVAVVLAAGHAPRAGSGGYGREFDAVFRTAGRQPGVDLVPDLLGEVLTRPDLKQADGLHPNAAGVRRLAARLAPAVAAAVRRSAAAPAAARPPQAVKGR